MSSPFPPSIRPATSEDIPALARLHVAAWRAAYPGIVPSDHLNRLTIEGYEAIWRRNMTDPDRVNLVAAEPESGVVGFVAFGPTHDAGMDPTRIAEIYGIYLHPAVWGTGYAGQLMEEALAGLKSGGFPAVTLWVWRDNRRARRFYQRMGFTQDGTEMVSDRFGPQLAELRYRRDL